MTKSNFTDSTLGICGYGFSGSGAVIDILRSNSQINYLNVGEFIIQYVPDGLSDLDYHLNQNVSRYLSSDIAIIRFKNTINGFISCLKSCSPSQKEQLTVLSDKFIQNLTGVSWKGYWNFDKYNLDGFHKILFRIGEKLKKNYRFDGYPQRTMYLSLYPENFNEKTRAYIQSFLDILGFDPDKINMLDQPFSTNTLSNSMAYYRNPHAIVVDRDPRDIYMLTKKQKIYNTSWIPTDSVQKYVSYFKTIRTSHEKTPENVLRIQYEDLIYNYHEQLDLLSDFLKIQIDHDNRSSFDPNISINNTQLFLSVNKTEQKNIEIIEEELSDYLYDFNKYSTKPNHLSGVF